MIKKEVIERQLNSQLQRKLKFTVNNKVIKRGKLLLFIIKDFYLNFVLVNDKGERKYYEVPYPYSVQETPEGNVVLDYTLDTLSQNNKMLFYRLKVVNRIKKSKLYDSKLIVEGDT